MGLDPMRKPWRQLEQVFLQIRCPFCYPTNNARALNRTRSTETKKDQQLGLILSCPNNWLLGKRSKNFDKR